MRGRSKKEQNSVLEQAARAYLQAGSGGPKEQVVEAAAPLVNYYASLYSPGKIDEDLRQAGYEGLLKALGRFDPGRGVLFATYAAHCIIGEIRHELRDRGPFKIPDWLKSLQSRVLAATEELAQENGAMPTLREIAHRVNVAEEGIVEAMQAGCVSLEEVDLTKVRHIYYESFKLPIEDRIALQISLDRMDRLQQQVIRLTYYEDLTQQQVAERLGLNQRRVSRILNRGLNEMRAQVV